MNDRAKIQIKWKGMQAFQRFLYDGESAKELFVFKSNPTFFREMFALATCF